MKHLIRKLTHFSVARYKLDLNDYDSFHPVYYFKGQIGVYLKLFTINYQPVFSNSSVVDILMVDVATEIIKFLYGNSNRIIISTIE